MMTAMLKMLKAHWAAASLVAALAAPWAHAERVQIESAVVESASGTTSAVSRSNGGVDSFFTMQKKMVYDTLVGIGISMDSLPPEVRIRLAQFETRNFEAFRAFCVGLNAQDEGRFADAKAAFKRALELDPSFGLAKTKETAMPTTDAVNALQMQAVLRDAVKSATQAGKDSVAVDVAHALAAIQAGITVVAVPQAALVDQSQQQNNSLKQNNNLQFGANTVVGVSYTINPPSDPPYSLAKITDWSSSYVTTTTTNQLTQYGASKLDLDAQIGGASQSFNPLLAGSATLTDGTKVYWGAWNSTPSNSALVKLNGSNVSSPQLGDTFTYMYASSTTVMPAAGKATFDPAGGGFSGATGKIEVDFGSRQVALKGLGFTLGGYTFSGLYGQASYAATGSGSFSGTYAVDSRSSCAGCTAFSPATSPFAGNFVGQAANGLIFSSIMQTGSGTASGVHLFKQ